MLSKKIAFVVQRYGLEVNGGAEYHCRLIAERLLEWYDVDVITTCAVNYLTWEDHYPEGETEINGVSVIRFSSHSRDMDSFNTYTSQLLSNPNRTLHEELEWINQQGPRSESLLRYIRENEYKYDAIIFFTYLYYQTYYGMQLVPSKSIFVPTAHDEPPIYFYAYNPTFHLPRLIMYNTDEEMQFIHYKFKNQYIPYRVVGTGVDIRHERKAERFREKYSLGEEPFLLYIGRIDESKGCREMFDYIRQYNSESEQPVKLVLLGKAFMEVPEDPYIIPLGFVTDEDKWDALEAAEMLLMPSPFESLSMVVLESMAVEKPALVNGRCEVLKGHCVKSNAGLYYRSYYEFAGCLDYLRNNPSLLRKMGINGRRYVEENYQWDIIIRQYRDAIESL